MLPLKVQQLNQDYNEDLEKDFHSDHQQIWNYFNILLLLLLFEWCLQNAVEWEEKKKTTMNNTLMQELLDDHLLYKDEWNFL